jgi:hypothetical protein
MGYELPDGCDVGCELALLKKARMLAMATACAVKNFIFVGVVKNIFVVQFEEWLLDSNQF